jgi:hypothetical protein
MSKGVLSMRKIKCRQLLMGVLAVSAAGVWFVQRALL